MIQKLALLVLVATFGLGFSMGCKEESSSSGTPTQSDVDKTEDAVKDAADKAGDAAKDAADKAGDAARDAADKAGG